MLGDLQGTLARMVRDIGGVRAALIVESAGIEVATWGQADFEACAAELSEIWHQLVSTDVETAVGPLESVEISGAAGRWVVLALGTGYSLAVLADLQVPPGKIRFYSSQWIREHGEDFS